MGQSLRTALWHHTCCLVVATAALWLAVVAPGGATVLTVDLSGGGDYLSLGEALAAAAHMDTILVSPGTYTGPGNRDSDFAGRTLAVLSTDGPSVTILDCEDTGRAFVMEDVGPPSARVRGFTIKNAHAYDDTVYWHDGYGGAVLCIDSSALLVDMVFTRNTADEDGGAVYMSGGESYGIIGCTFTENTAPVYGQGGAVRAGYASSVSIVDCDFVRNVAESWGGGVYATSVYLVISDVRFEGNRGSMGGALNLRHTDGTPTISSCTFDHNWAEHHGGAVSCYDATATFTDCAFTSNSSRYYGAAVGVTAAPCEFERSQFFRNEVREYDGAVIATSRASIITDCTLAYNSTLGGAAIVSSGASHPVITNTILAFNEFGPGLLCADTSIPEVSYSCSFGNAVTDSLCGMYHDNIFLDPAFCDTTGGYLAVQDCSPCVGSGLGGTTIGCADTGCPCGDPTGVGEPAETAISHRCLRNPGNSGATISYALGGGCAAVTLHVYDATGRLVYTDSATAGDARGGAFTWNGGVAEGHPAASGVYFYRLSACGETATGRFVLLR